MSYYVPDERSESSYNYEFGSFDYGGSYSSQQGRSDQPQAQASIFTPQSPDQFNTNPFENKSDDPYADEPPLLEELGINFDHIWVKTLAVLNPFRTTDSTILHDTDFAGPLVFCLAFGCFLLLSGKIHFGYIYGILVLGCITIYAILNLMSQSQSISISCTVSVLGYCLLPMVLLAGVALIIKLNTGIVGNSLALLAVVWCAFSASKLFVTAINSHNQQPLILYPCALLYGVFALLTVF